MRLVGRGARDGCPACLRKGKEMKLVIVRGIPGSGKTWWAEAYAHEHECMLLESDRLRRRDGEYVFDPNETDGINNTQNIFLRMCAKHNADVVMVGLFSKVRTINRMIDYARTACRNKVDVQVIRMTGDFNNVHNVPANVVEDMLCKFEDYPGEKFTDPEDYDE